jgi:hypothetical protein
VLASTAKEDIPRPVLWDTELASVDEVWFRCEPDAPERIADGGEEAMTVDAPYTGHVLEADDLDFQLLGETRNVTV